MHIGAAIYRMQARVINCTVFNVLSVYSGFLYVLTHLIRFQTPVFKQAIVTVAITQL